ncbi:UvrD-helicase domain-containing protein [Tumebacillus sp. ITR2]|uniref:DNA 3'-5' helicase n=1 Tax=Tumebacillus amylolyticus TaxID=2801339 RepID=A0ABS1J913_9BACL|nr:UvrD-helicase domain-containing protein [Tumebacillus amylolyticus]MBL0386752.1 UvrD-helicase domain-containing protein [Tumebacillus amylolyticus]
MTDPRPTTGQWKAIRDLERHLTVSAGAGAGKTWVLTERYTAMLAGYPLILPPLELETEANADSDQHPSRPGQIVAITFTKEAAGEMKARIRERLSRWKHEAADEDKRRIALLQEEVERATITTIHGYCSDLLRQYPLEAGIDPQARVLEESEAMFRLEEAVREALDEGLAREDAGTLALITEYAYEPLLRHIMDFYPSVREQTEDFTGMTSHTLAMLDELSAGLESAVDTLESLIGNILSLDLDALDAKKGSVARALRLRAEYPAISKVLTQWRASGWEYTPDIAVILETLTSGWGVLVKELKPDVNALKAHVPSVSRHIVPSGLRDTVVYLADLLQAVHTLYTEKKNRDRALDFTDLQNLAVRLLQRPDVRNWQAKSLRFLMVDEFQDTNPVQKHLLDALTTGNDDLRLFVVGDAKQSIYRFRGADLQVFLDTQREVGESGGEHVPLAHNFRTQEPIITFVNSLFDLLMPGTYEPMQATRPATHDQPMVEVLHLTEEPGSLEQKLIEARIVATRIREMVGGGSTQDFDGSCGESLLPNRDGTLRTVQYRDITILFSAMTHVYIYEHALQQAGIPYYIVGSRDFFRRQEIFDLVSVLQVLVEEHDTVARIGALRSPLFGVSDEALYWLGREGLTAPDWRELPNWHRLALDDREKLMRAQTLFQLWREEKSYKNAAEVLTSILHHTGYEQALLLTFGGDQKVGNVRKLVEIAYDQPPERGSVLAFLSEVQKRIDGEVREEDAQVESDQSDVVKIMTIHKSKGLEFPVVILPDMARTFNLSEGGKFRYDSKLGLVPSFTENDAWNDFGYSTKLSEDNKQKALAEERRKLYVAMTRARDYLLLVGTRALEKKTAPTLEDSRWFGWLQAAEVQNWEGVRWVQIGPTEGTFEKNTAVAEATPTLEIPERPGTSEPPLTELFPLLGPIQPRADEMPGLTLSVSALLTYFTCPRQYFYKYALRLPELARPLEDTQQISLFDADETVEEPNLTSTELADTDAEHDPTVRGTLVHRVLELLQDPADLQTLLRHALAERKIVGDEADAWIPILEGDLVRYTQSEIFREVQSATEQHSEMMFRLRAGRHAITGVIDKLYKKDNGRAVVLDYKTNRITRRQLKRTTHHYTPQLQLYTLVAVELLGWHVERAVLYFTALDEESEVSIAPADLETMQSRLQAACDHIAMHDDETDFAQTEELGTCGRCPYQLICRGDMLS